MSGFARIAPISKWPTLASAVLVTVLAVGFLIHSWTVSDVVYARGPAGSDITLQTATEQRLLVLAAPYAATSDVSCGEDGSVRVRHQLFSSGGRDFHGERYAYLGLLSTQWQPGDTLRCSGGGVDEILVVTDEAGQARTAGLMIGAGAFVLWIWTAVTFAVARQARRQSR